MSRESAFYRYILIQDQEGYKKSKSPDQLGYPSNVKIAMIDNWLASTKNASFAWFVTVLAVIFAAHVYIEAGKTGGKRPVEHRVLVKK